MSKQLKVRTSDYIILGSYLLVGFLGIGVLFEFTTSPTFLIHLVFFLGNIMAYLFLWFRFKNWVFQYAPWKKDSTIRLRFELIWSVATGLGFSISYILFSYFFSDFPRQNYWSAALLVGTAILFWSIFVTLAGEFLHLILSVKSTKTRINLGKNEILKLRKEVLQDLISPHFLFNSLNTISSFVTENKAKSIRIVKELSELYRFMLINSHKNVVLLKEDLELAKRYSFLLQSRLEKGIEIHFDIQNECLDLYVPPLTLQNLIENAVKHNIATKKSILSIYISSKEGNLVVRNNLNPKLNSGSSTGLGLNYIESQVEQIIGKKLGINSNSEYFEVTIPLIEESNLLLDESFNY